MSEQPITHCEHGIDRAYRCIDCIEAERDQLRAELASLRASIVTLAEEWEGQAAVAEGMANDPDTKARIESWRNAAAELRQLAEGSSAAAQEGL